MKKRRKKIKNKRNSDRKITKHHIIPSSRGGNDSEGNISYILNRPHIIYHILFRNKKPDEI